MLRIPKRLVGLKMFARRPNLNRFWSRFVRITIVALSPLLFVGWTEENCEAQQSAAQESSPSASIEDLRSSASRFEGVNLIEVGPYSDCIELSNDSTRVVLGHHRGGRILVYERAGKNVIWMANEQNWDPNRNYSRRQASGFRI